MKDDLITSEAIQEVQSESDSKTAVKEKTEPKKGRRKAVSASPQKRERKKALHITAMTMPAESPTEPIASEAEPARRKRVGRKPMSESEKAIAARKRAEEKAKADSMVPVLLLQYQGDEIDIVALIAAAKADFKAGHKRTLITDLKLYLKPEEQMAYYVVNGTVSGGVPFNK